MRRGIEFERDRPENPRFESKFFSKITFWYTFQLFKIGFKRDFTERDLTKPLPVHASKSLGDHTTVMWLEEKERAAKKYRTPTLFRVLLKQFRREIMYRSIFLMIIELFIRIVQPLFIGLLIRYFLQRDYATADLGSGDVVNVRYMGRLWHYFTPQQQRISLSEAYFFATGVVLTSIIVVLILHPYQMEILHTGMKMRIASCSLIYRKALHLDLSKVGDTTIGNVLNLMSTDVFRLDAFPYFLHYIWVSLIQYAVLLYFLYRTVNVAAFFGALPIICSLPLYIVFCFRMATIRKQVANKTDYRVRLMKEIITGIQVIKMYAWEYPFVTMVNNARKDEIKTLKRTIFIKGTVLSFIMFSFRIATFVSLLSYVLLGNDISAETVFFVSSCYQIVRQCMTAYLPQALIQMGEVHVAINRINDFLRSPETAIKNSTPLNRKSSKYPSRPQQEELYVKLNNVSAFIDSVQFLHNISFVVKPGQLTLLVGSVGAGKSSLLKTILGEIRPSFGSVQVNGTMSYAGPEPWLFEGSVRQNITFGQAYIKQRYKEVIGVCALVSDFRLLPSGDLTLVGERGISLSGGQRARINLARCIYRRADIYLLDDPLSAVDTNVGKTLFNECIRKYLRNKIVILATHQLQYLKGADQIVILEGGRVTAIGTFDSLKGITTGFGRLIHDIGSTGPKIDEIEQVYKTSFDNQSRGGSITRSEKTIVSYGSVIFEMRTTGAIAFGVFKGYFKAGGNACMVVFVFFLCVLTQVIASLSDWFLSEWTLYEEDNQYPEGHVNHTSNFHTHLTRDLSIYIYTAIIGSLVVMALLRSFLFFLFCMKASVKLHDQMFKSIIHASMQFFTLNTSGRILNRFSKDIGAIDEILPICMIDTIQVLFNLGGVILVLTIVNWILIFPALVACILFIFLRRFYLKTSRSVKRLEGISRSPMYTHLNATLSGLPTIRTHGNEKFLCDEFDNYQDLHSSSYFMFLSTTKAFGYWCDLLCAIFITFVTFCFLFLPEKPGQGAYVGLSITQCIGLMGLFQWGMRQSAEMENQMTSVERVLEFSAIDHEPPLESSPEFKPPPSWPSQGKIEFLDTTLTYDANAEEPVLNHLSFGVLPGEKIGIVGRTGAGKSSLISCLFRTSVYEGTIFIDGLDIGLMGLHDIREKISIIPQEPFIFSGTLKYNLDPFGKHKDDDILEALKAVDLSAAIEIGVASLDLILHDSGANLSNGQKQLVCLARAVLRNNKIMVMDEATANMDSHTDAHIQETIQRVFQDCTVLTIAHRLNTIMDYDRVIVMDQGSIVEFDQPYLLLQHRTGLFNAMVVNTGRPTSEYLRTVALQSYKKKQQRDEVKKKEREVLIKEAEENVSKHVEEGTKKGNQEEPGTSGSENIGKESKDNKKTNKKKGG